MATATAAPPVLDLITERERLTVKIDGVAYDLRDENDLTLEHYRLLEQAGQRMTTLEALPKMSKKQQAEYHELLKDACLLALDAPDAVIDRTGYLQRIAIFRTFSELSAPSLLRMGASMQAARTAAAQSRGTSSSPASSGSTAGRTRRSGSRRSR